MQEESKNIQAEEQQINNSDDTIQLLDDGKKILINFGKILNVEELNEDNPICVFELKKRSYFSISDLITNNIRNVFKNCTSDIILNYLKISYHIMNQQIKYDKNEFEKELNEIVLNDNFLLYMNNYIDENYITINELSSAGKLEDIDEVQPQEEETHKKGRRAAKVNEELQFTDEHIKILLKVAFVSCVTIPLITKFCFNRTVQDVNNFIYYIICSFIRHFEEDNLILNKLHRFIYSRVVSTQYSDKTIWNVMTSKSKDVQIITQEFLQDVIIGILPKAVFNFNLINLLHVVIKKKLNFEFSKNYKYAYKPINLNQVDSDGLTQYDKCEMGMANKKNESKSTISDMTISFMIKQLPEKLLVEVSDEEIDYYIKHISINKLQNQILFLFYSKYVGDYTNLYACNKRQYITLLVLLYKYCKTKSLNIIAELLIATPENYKEERVTVRNAKTFDKIKNSQIYIDLLKNKYSNLGSLIYENNAIIGMIGSFSMMKMISVPNYEDYKYNNIQNGEEIVTNISDIADDFIQLVNEF